jgi:lysine 2,3-aminomutase
MHQNADFAAKYSRDAFKRTASSLLNVVKRCPSFDVARDRLRARVSQLNFDTLGGRIELPSHELIRIRDCGLVMSSILSRRADARSGFSVARALWDVAQGQPRDDLSSAFFAELTHLVRGLEGRARFTFIRNRKVRPELSGRDAAILRSRELDRMWQTADAHMAQWPSGLDDDAVTRRRKRAASIQKTLGGSPEDWTDWRWQLRHVVTDPELLQRLVRLTPDEEHAVRQAHAARLPFGVTPHYLSLMDDGGGSRDMAIRAQVLPDRTYVEHMIQHRHNLEHSCDFMLESDTSPVDLVTRRYPAIAILKPFNTCPQICVYCQRNWEIDQAMAPGAMARTERIADAIRWIDERPAIKEILVTGGDPLSLSDGRLRTILDQVAGIDHVDLIRIGTRTPVTLPMRITPALARLLARYREPGRRELAVVTHVEHPYEITPEVVQAVDRLRRVGISVYNQHVYTFFVSRRFEAAKLRMLLRRIGIDPYYTFAPKGKDETASFRVPIARILQEQKEEARLMPGTRRTDEAVYNVPGLGKNYLRALQHRDLISVQADGSRSYEFHPWEKNLVDQDTWVAKDMPILDYLRRLAAIGEDPEQYQSIWYYF